MLYSVQLYPRKAFDKTEDNPEYTLIYVLAEKKLKRSAPNMVS